MHLLENGGHTLLCTFFLSHLGKLTARNGCLFVTFLEFLVRQEVLCHDARDLFEVVQDGKPCIFDLFLGWTELAEIIVQVKGRLWSCLAMRWER